MANDASPKAVESDNLFISLHIQNPGPHHRLPSTCASTCWMLVPMGYTTGSLVEPSNDPQRKLVPALTSLRKFGHGPLMKSGPTELNVKTRAGVAPPEEG